MNFTKKKIWIISLVSLLVLLAVVALLMKSKSADKETSAENGSKKKTLITVLAQEFKRQDVPDYVQVSGTLTGRAQVEMVAGVSGQLRKLHKSLGDWVEKGQSIGDIDASVKKAHYEQAKALLAVAANNLKASKELYKTKQISEVEHQGMVANYASTQATFASAKIAYDYAQMKAPVSGYITDLPVEEGQSLSANEFVCKVVNYNKLCLNTGVGESSVLKMEKGQRVDLSPDGNEMLLAGTVEGVGKAPAYNSAVYPVKIELDGGENLLPGMTVTAQVAVGIFENVKAISYDALLQEYDDYYVFRLNKDNTVSKVKVVFIKMVGNLVIVESSLKDGDFIVIDGVDEIDEGQEVDPKYYNSSAIQTDSEVKGV